ncbi:MAG: hypothetical protein IJO61_03245 [Oscillospiraceae bacterium]|nr:hypothetical protein [Oscillospiraceae bacterium]
MIKKILPIILCLILVFGISASAANTQGDTPAENSHATEEMPNRQGRPQGGGRGNMGMPPNMPSGEAPPELPEGMTPPEMPNGEMPPGMTDQEQNTEEKAENIILTFVKMYSTPIISVVLLAFAFVFVIFYKRKSY